ncbi:MAG: hypothetical protein AAF639_20025 [Chloroflexota bacterium]
MANNKTKKKKNETDSPLKRLVGMAPIDFAEWLLKTQVSRAEEANIELQDDPVPLSADTLYWITLAQPMVHESGPRKGQTYDRVLLHIEFQGKSTWKPMRLRELDYIVRVQDEEIIKMVETLIRHDDWVLDTPFIRRLREEGRAAEREVLREERQSFQQEREVWLRERIQHQQELERVKTLRLKEMEVRRQDILKFMVSRYDPSAAEYLRVQELLSTISNHDKFNSVWAALLRLDDFGQFYLAVEELVNAENKLDV